MNQQEVRHFVERYFASFSTPIEESHPTYLTVTLPKEVDKDIGNRPFYWSWVEKMDLAPQPLVLTFFFDPEDIPEGIRGEQLHFGSGRLHQIFQSTRNHGRFVCMYEHHQLLLGHAAGRRSVPLTPWLGVNLKISFICDKKRDMLLYLGINLHQPRLVHDFYPFLKRLSLSPGIPDYFYTLDRRLSLEQAMAYVKQEAETLIAKQDHSWADQARERLAEELEILDAYYTELALREPETSEESKAEKEEEPPVGTIEPVAKVEVPVVVVEEEPPAPPQSLDDFRSGGGRILDFLRINGIQETPKEEINQEEWKKSTPEEEKERRRDELIWQYEPRIEVSIINAGLFYLHNMPPFSSGSLTH